MRIIFVTFFLAFSLVVSAQQLKSPKDFLGYELGSKFTPYFKVVDYFNHAAAAMPSMIKLEEYGKTYEGRPLLLAVVSSKENIGRLEDIRQNSMRLSRQMNDRSGDVNQPAIVWLSYNVHGNEASSTEVAMRALYELLAPSRSTTNDYLKNTVIIIDPCLNPDGRDRYVNWYNQVAGVIPDADPDSREHQEPWPSGRPNHYNFDLNRDWAWQSQVETQQRIKVYNKWLPSIHVDFHEQYPGSPYYFAPAAEPLHEVITPFQRDFQSTIGRNHARYFDAEGWLYFTKEYFDLFYPAYGDTYPIYSGSIGMTYEQAGHGMAGLAIAINGDTLKLSDRIDHHFTTTMSTIEVASQNAAKLNSELKKYFDDGVQNGSGIYKSYVVSGENPAKLKSLAEFFDRNAITYGYSGKKMQVKGYNYFTGKDESYTTGEGDMVISAFQPKAALLRVLFEPKSRLSDSATYDITAWALPYAYGLQSYAVKERLSGVAQAPAKASPAAFNPSGYGYLIQYRSFNDGKFLAALMKNGFRVRIAEREFQFGKVNYAKGTLVILRNGNDRFFSSLPQLANAHDVTLNPVTSGFMEAGFDFGSDKIVLLKKPRVAMLTGEGVVSTNAGEVWHFFEQQLKYPLTLINAKNLPNASLKNFDVLILPDGNYPFLSAKDGAIELKAWIKQGGKLIAMENAVSQMASGDWGIKHKKDDEKDEKKSTYADLKRYEDRERDGIADHIPGAIYRTELDNSHPLAFGYPSTYYSLKLDGNIYEFLSSGWNVGVIKQENEVSGFVGSRVREKLKDGLVLGVQPSGRGTIVYMADNPLFRSFWENGKLLFTNAVFLAGQ